MAQIIGVSKRTNNRDKITRVLELARIHPEVLLRYCFCCAFWCMIVIQIRVSKCRVIAVCCVFVGRRLASRRQSVSSVPQLSGHQRRVLELHWASQTMNAGESWRKNNVSLTFSRLYTLTALCTVYRTLHVLLSCGSDIRFITWTLSSDY